MTARACLSDAWYRTRVHRTRIGWGCRSNNWRRHGFVCHLIEVIDDTLLHHGIRFARVSLKYLPGLEHRVLYARCALACLAHNVGMVTDGDRHERRVHTSPQACTIYRGSSLCKFACMQLVRGMSGQIQFFR